MVTNKNKQTSWLLSTVIVLSFTFTSAILNIIVTPLLGGENFFSGQNVDYKSLLIFATIILIVILLLISLFAFWLYKFFSDAYFDEYAIKRWGIFGFLFALFLQISVWFLHNKFPVFQFLLGIVFLLLAFFIARKIYPLNKKL